MSNFQIKKYTIDLDNYDIRQAYRKANLQSKQWFQKNSFKHSFYAITFCIDVNHDSSDCFSMDSLCNILASFLQSKCSSPVWVSKHPSAFDVSDRNANSNSSRNKSRLGTQHAPGRRWLWDSLFPVNVVTTLALQISRDSFRWPRQILDQNGFLSDKIQRSCVFKTCVRA